MAINCNPSDFAAKVAAALHDYSSSVLRTISAETVTCGKDCVAELKRTSPRRKGPHGGDYARSWAVTKESSSGGLVVSCVIHNKRHYQLTHLLENGHETRNGGRTKPQPHIKPAEDRVVATYLQRAKEAIEKG